MDKLINYEINYENHKSQITNQQRLRTEQGFTLIELSIVVVIIGLIVAGVVGGQALVNQSKIRTLINEINQYQIAVNTFKLEYNNLPGDIPNAHDYWGNNCDSIASRCNGNGNKIVGWNLEDSGSSLGSQDHEPFRQAQHLSLAGLLSSNYTGAGSLCAASSSTCLSKSDVMYSKSGKGKFVLNTSRDALIFLAAGSKSSGDSPIKRGNLSIIIGGAQEGTITETASFEVKEAFNIDRKIDDGHANTGILYSIDGSGLAANSCSSPSNVIGGADYNTANLDNNVLNCTLNYFLGY